VGALDRLTYSAASHIGSLSAERAYVNSGQTATADSNAFCMKPLLTGLARGISQ
jgi:hypothetical protein